MFDVSENEVAPINVEFAGARFLLDGCSGSDLIAQKIQIGSYEAPLPMLLSAVLSRVTGVFLDVGANNGVYSLIGATTKRDLEIVAFEPFPPVLTILYNNIRLNDLVGRIRVVEVALSDVNGLSPIFLPDQEHGLVETSASLQDGFIPGAQRAMDVITKRLDDVDLTGPIGVIKVDIEGYELEFLRGAENTICRDRPIIFAEMLSAAVHKFPEITSRLAQLDYLTFRLRPDVAILSHWIQFDDQAWNYGLIPREKMPIFRQVCVQHGLEILAPA